MLIGTIYVLVLVLASRSTKNPLDIKNPPFPPGSLVLLPKIVIAMHLFTGWCSDFKASSAELDNTFEIN